MALNNIQSLLAQADKQRGFPTGTMASIMQQETGGNAKYLDDPTAYHYGLNAEGKRVAGHTGKISTAFGPFGILESTGRDPGYGVQPLQNKSLEEQVRFASDYLDARSKSAGSLTAGLAGYGEGAKYATQVARRRDGGTAPVPVMAQAVPVPVPQEVMPVAPQVVAQAAPVQLQAPPPVPDAVPPPPVQVAQAQAPQDMDWGSFQQAMPQAFQPQDLNFGRAAVGTAAFQPSGFGRFKGLVRKA